MSTAPHPLLLEHALAHYRELHLASRNLSPITRVKYLSDLKDLVSFLAGALGLPRADQVERTHLERYLAELDRRGLKGSSRRRKVASIKSFFAFLEREGLIPLSPATKLIPPQRERDEPRVLSEIEYKRLEAAVHGEIRDEAIIQLLLQTGIRLAELARLKTTDVELPAKIVPPNKKTQDPGTVGAVHIHGKGRKERTVTINWKACKALRNYLQVRPRLPDEDALFLTKFGLPMGPRSIENVVAKHAAAAGIAGASPHALRHTFATHHVKKGTSLASVRAALGHESLATTSIYVGLAREQMDKELQQNAL
jgi:site-specific recombinase XerD